MSPRRTQESMPSNPMPAVTNLTGRYSTEQGYLHGNTSADTLHPYVCWFAHPIIAALSCNHEFPRAGATPNKAESHSCTPIHALLQGMDANKSNYNWNRLKARQAHGTRLISCLPVGPGANEGVVHAPAAPCRCKPWVLRVSCKCARGCGKHSDKNDRK